MDGRRKLAGVIVALILLLVLLSSLAGAAPWGGPWLSWGMGPGMMGAMMGWKGAAPVQPPGSAPAAATGGAGLPLGLVIILMAGVILLAWLVIPRTTGAGKSVERRETPLEIAKRRYVTGEISLPEYEEILSTLVGSGEPLDGGTRKVGARRA